MGDECRAAGLVEALDEAGPPVAPGLGPGGGRVGLGEGAQQVEGRGRAVDGVRERDDRRRVLGVAAGGQLDEGEVLPDQSHDGGAVGVGDTHPPEHRVGELGPGHGVVLRARHLADVVEHRREHEQVGPGDVADHAARRDDGLDEVAVDGVPVHGVALRAAAHRLPLRDPPLDDAGEVEPLPHGDEPGPRREQVREEVASHLGPRLGQGGRAGGEVLQRRRRQGYAAACGHDRGPQRGDRVGRQVGRRSEDRLPVVPVEAVAERGELRAAGTDAQGAGALGLHGAAQGAVDGIRDGACRRREVGEQVVGVGVAEQGGARVLVVAGQPVAARAR